MSDKPNEIKLLDAIEGDENGDGWLPELSLVHSGSNELHIIVGEEAEGMAEGVSAENFERLRERIEGRPSEGAAARLLLRLMEDTFSDWRTVAESELTIAEQKARTFLLREARDA